MYVGITHYRLQHEQLYVWNNFMGVNRTSYTQLQMDLINFYINILNTFKEVRLGCR